MQFLRVLSTIEVGNFIVGFIVELFIPTNENVRERTRIRGGHPMVISNVLDPVFILYVPFYWFW